METFTINEVIEHLGKQKKCTSFTMYTHDLLEEFVHEHIAYSPCTNITDLCKDLSSFILEYCVINPVNTLICRNPTTIENVDSDNYNEYNTMDITLCHKINIVIRNHNPDFKCSFKNLHNGVQKILRELLKDKKTNKRSNEELMDEFFTILDYEENSTKKQRIN